MADLYSDHYALAVSQASPDDPHIKVPAGIDHAALRYKRGTITTTVATAAADVLRFFPMRSSDRLLNLFLSHTADASTSAAGDCGLHDSPDEQGVGGAAVDTNLWCPVGTAPMIDITLAIDRVDILLLGDLANEDIGTRLWEMADVGAATFTVDPQSLFDITMRISAEVGIVVTEYVMEAVYTAGAGS